MAREYGAGIWLFGQFVDRYASDGYGPPVTTVQALVLHELLGTAG
jgi:xylose isomerase